MWLRNPPPAFESRTVRRMEPLLYILALAGVSALLPRLVRALFAVLHRTGQAWPAGDAAKRRPEQGDITGLAEADAQERAARRGRRIAIIELAHWVAFLLAPPYTPWPREIYAPCAVLWLFVRARVRTGTLVDVRR